MVIVIHQRLTRISSVHIVHGQCTTLLFKF